MTPLPISNSTDKHSLFCHQFIAGPEYLTGLEGWKKIEASDQLRITCHPELEVTQATKGASSITLIGHMLDSDDPSATNQQILEKIVSQFSDISTLIGMSAPYGGRWLIIAVKGEEQYLFHDALGLRQVFYTDATLSDSVWLMSQPGLAMKLFHLEIDDKARSFLDSPHIRSSPEFSWPAYATPFSQIHHLLPNHCLDLNTRTQYRYWPGPPVDPIDPDQAVDELAHRLQNSVTAIVNRFDDVVLGMTAGLDSRLVLAAARESSGQIGYVTIQQHNMPENHPDLRVPEALLGKLKLPHSIVYPEASMSPDFEDLFKENVFLSHPHYGRDAEALLSRYNRKKVVITGSGAEVGRCPYRKKLSQFDQKLSSGSGITAEVLAALDDMPESSYAISHFNEWLAGLNNTEKTNEQILDLFSWENGHGNWLAMTQMEFDIAWREIFTPYNCRSILTAMMSVKEAERGYPDYKLVHALMEKMWPEVLSEPINPIMRHPKSLSGHIKRAIRKSASIFQ